MIKPAPALISGAAAALSLAACAAGPVTSRYADELDRLEQDCRARGGILTPAPRRANLGNPAADHFCEIRGGATRTPR